VGGKGKTKEKRKAKGYRTVRKRHLSNPEGSLRGVLGKSLLGCAYGANIIVKKSLQAKAAKTGSFRKPWGSGEVVTLESRKEGSHVVGGEDC